eukprot:10203795-Alexandrium_andersonii.AAC.1
MSASLVGSEMCIRDSFPARTGGATAPPGPPRMAPPARSAGGAIWGGPGAVSYTHLTLPTICSV